MRAMGNRMRTAVACVVATVVLTLVVVAGFVLRGQAVVADFDVRAVQPCWEHPFGTDWMGRDMLARTLAGLSTSVMVGLLSAAVSAAIALVLASAAALGGRATDAAVTWLVDLLMGIPHVVLLILVSYALGKGFVGVTCALALTHWPSLTRVLRAEILQCRESEYVAHARRLGVGPARIARVHMLPAVLPHFVVGLVLLFPHAVMHEAAITFLGFGLPPDVPAVGTILSESMGYLSAGMWWLAAFPGVALVGVVMLFDVVGSGLRRLLDPRSNQE